MSGVCNREGIHKGFQCVYGCSQFRIDHDDNPYDCRVCMEEQSKILEKEGENDF